MTRPRPQVQLIVDVESMMREMVSSSEAQSQAQEPPPKYEELEDEEVPPPQYSSCVLQIREEENETSGESNDNTKNQDPKPENLAVMEQSVRRFV